MRLGQIDRDVLSNENLLGKRNADPEVNWRNTVSNSVSVESPKGFEKAGLCLMVSRTDVLSVLIVKNRKHNLSSC